MKQVLRWGLAVLAFCCIALGVLVVVLADTSPLVTRANVLTEWGSDRAQGILAELDPQNLEEGEVVSQTIEVHDVDGLVNYVANKYFEGRALVQMGDQIATIRFSREMKGFLKGNFLNVQVQLSSTAGQVEIDQVQFGRYVLPKSWLPGLLERLVRHTGEQAVLEKMVAHTRRVQFSDNGVALTLALNDEALPDVKALAFSSDDRMRLYQAQAALARISKTPAAGGSMPLSEVLTSMLRRSGAKSDEDLLAQEYQAALFVLAAHSAQVPLTAILPEARTWPRARPVALTLYDQESVARHFLVAAAAAAWRSKPLSERIFGFWPDIKVLENNRFSFAALMGARAGLRFGEMTQEEAERVAARVVGGRLEDAQLLPPVAEWLTPLTEAGLQQQYGGINGARFLEVFNQLDGVVAALPLYNPITEAEIALAAKASAALDPLPKTKSATPSATPATPKKPKYNLPPQVEFELKSAETKREGELADHNTQAPAPVVDAQPVIILPEHSPEVRQ